MTGPFQQNAMKLNEMLDADVLIYSGDEEDEEWEHQPITTQPTTLPVAQTLLYPPHPHNSGTTTESIRIIYSNDDSSNEWESQPFAVQPSGVANRRDQEISLGK